MKVKDLVAKLAQFDPELELMTAQFKYYKVGEEGLNIKEKEFYQDIDGQIEDYKGVERKLLGKFCYIALE